MVMVYRDKDVRQQVAIREAGGGSLEEILADPASSDRYYHFINDVPMIGEKKEDGKYVKGIEDYFPKEQYESDEFQTAVVQDIIENWLTMSRNNKFHAIFATSSIPEAIRYYRKFREMAPDLKVTGMCLLPLIPI